MFLIVEPEEGALRPEEINAYFIRTWIVFRILQFLDRSTSVLNQNIVSQALRVYGIGYAIRISLLRWTINPNRKEIEEKNNEQKDPVSHYANSSFGEYAVLGDTACKM